MIFFDKCFAKNWLLKKNHSHGGGVSKQQSVLNFNEWTVVWGFLILKWAELRGSYDLLCLLMLLKF